MEFSCSMVNNNQRYSWCLGLWNKIARYVDMCKNYLFIFLFTGLYTWQVEFVIWMNFVCLWCRFSHFCRKLWNHLEKLASKTVDKTRSSDEVAKSEELYALATILISTLSSSNLCSYSRRLLFWYSWMSLLYCLKYVSSFVCW